MELLGTIILSIVLLVNMYKLLVQLILDHLYTGEVKSEERD